MENGTEKRLYKDGNWHFNYEIEDFECLIAIKEVVNQRINMMIMCP